MIDRLANGDITKFQQIYEIPYREVLNLLSYWLVRDKAQYDLQKIEEVQQNAKRIR